MRARAVLAGVLLAGGAVVASAAPAGASSPAIITTVAGGPGRGVGRNVSQLPAALAAGPAGAVYVADVGGVVRALHAGSSWESVAAGVGGPPVFSGDGRSATKAGLGNVLGVAADGAGDALLSDTGNERVRMVAASTGTFYGQHMFRGDIYTVAGDGAPGFGGDGGPATAAELTGPEGLAVDASGNVLVTDTGNSRIRVVAASTGTFYGQAMTAGDIYTIAGDGGAGFAGDGGPATAAELFDPSGVAVDATGNVVIGDSINNRVRVVAASTGTFYGQAMTAGDIYTVAGSGQFGFSGDGGPATAATMEFPGEPAVDAAGNLVIPDFFNDRVRVVAGRAGTFYGQAMTAGDIYPVAGTGHAGYSGDGGPATTATLRYPGGATFDQAGNLVIADSGNDAVRVVAAGTGTFYGRAMTTGHIYTVAGTGHPGFSGDGGPATAAELNGPRSVAADGAGNLVITDTRNNRIRVVAESAGTFYGQAMTAGDIYTVAGTGEHGDSGNRGPATAARLTGPGGVTADAAGNLVIADTGNSRIRVVAVATGTFYGQAMTAGDIYGVAGTGHPGYSGDGGRATAAQLALPGGVAVDAAGNLVIADTGNNRIRVVAESHGTFYGTAMTAHRIYTVAGTGTAGFGGDSGPATGALLTRPGAVAVDPAGDILVADTGNDRIRQITG